MTHECFVLFIVLPILKSLLSLPNTQGGSFQIPTRTVSPRTQPAFNTILEKPPSPPPSFFFSLWESWVEFRHHFPLPRTTQGNSPICMQELEKWKICPKGILRRCVRNTRRCRTKGRPFFTTWGSSQEVFNFLLFWLHIITSEGYQYFTRTRRNRAEVRERFT